MPSAPCSLSSWSFNPTCQCGLAVHLLTFCSKFYESVRWMASVYCLSDISRQSGAEKVLIIRPLKFIECNILSQTTCPDVTLSQTTCPVHQSADHQHHRLQSAVMLHTMVSLSSPSTKGFFHHLVRVIVRMVGIHHNELRGAARQTEQPVTK